MLTVFELLVLNNFLNFLENLLVLLIHLDLATPLDHFSFVWSQVLLSLWYRVDFVHLESEQVMVIWKTIGSGLGLDT